VKDQKRQVLKIIECSFKANERDEESDEEERLRQSIPGERKTVEVRDESKQALFRSPLSPLSTSLGPSTLAHNRHGLIYENEIALLCPQPLMKWK
jgi:hypothetical protein